MIFILSVFIISSIAFYLFKKKKTIHKIPLNTHDILSKKVLFYKKLNGEEQTNFRNQIEIFINRVSIEPVDFELIDLDILLVASSAIIPIFRFNGWFYPNIKTVIIYPDYFNKDLEFNSKSKDKNIGGLVGNGRFKNNMILSRKALYHGFSNKTDKGNTGIHEFVHLLDKLDGNIDGIPKALLNNKNILPWLDLIHDKIEAINNDKSDIRNYGGTSKEEFFAVASEYFFERPLLLQRKHPDLYKMLYDCFIEN